MKKTNTIQEKWCYEKIIFCCVQYKRGRKKSSCCGDFKTEKRKCYYY